MQANRSWVALVLSLFIHKGCRLSCRLKLLLNSVFYGCERSHSDGSSLRAPRGACWCSFKRVAFNSHSKSTQMAPRAVRRFSDGELHCRHIYFPEGDAVLTCSDGLNVKRHFLNELYIDCVEKLAVCKVEY